MAQSYGESIFALHCRIDKLTPTAEYKFHPDRKWRFDFAFIPEKLAVEIEGGVWLGKNGGHTSGTGYTNNLEKYNEAVMLGWKILRFTPEAVKSGRAIQIVRVVLADSKPLGM